MAKRRVVILRMEPSIHEAILAFSAGQPMNTWILNAISEKLGKDSQWREFLAKALPVTPSIQKEKETK